MAEKDPRQWAARGDTDEEAKDRKPQSDTDSVVKKGGIARSTADTEDVTRDTAGFPANDGGLGVTTEPPDVRTGEAARANARLDEALERSRAEGPGAAGEGGEEPGTGQPEGERTSGRNRLLKGENIDEAEAPGE